ncbi:MAG: type II toxin-antitoxin system VapC family toxin [Chloroflexi bacterium]|nr:type II toxin-antitoxin system VapC family toxin [Chloroflexota bacterium]
MAGVIFVDASAWVALLYPNDKNHGRVALLWKEMVDNDWPLCTTNWTLYEAATFLSCRAGRHDWAMRLLALAENITVLSADEVELEAVSTFRDHGDKRWSMVDCVNFHALRKHGCQHAVAFDKNFQQAQEEFGFNVLH